MKHPPYHLRTNKAVDRLLLAEIIRALGSDSQFSDFTYYSLAGPFLEDLRVMDHFFPEMKLVSIESNMHTYKRQLFNQFCSRLNLRESSLSEFLMHEYEPNCKDVFWLDYTDLKFKRFSEFQQLLKIAIPTSIIRITLRAEPEININSLIDRLTDEEVAKLKGQVQRNFIQEFDQIIPPLDLESVFHSYSGYAKLVQMMVKLAASQALDFPGSEVDFLPVQCARYNDNTQMVTVTGIVCRREEIQEIKNRMNSVRFSDFGWEKIAKIDVPALTVKERLFLEEYLPVNEGQDAGELLLERLGYNIDNSAKLSKLKLSHYADCHRDYPNFVQVSL